MVKQRNTQHGRWLLLIFAVMASLIFTGCDTGHLGAKSGIITGYVLDVNTNQPISDILITATGQVGSGISHASTYTEGDGIYSLVDLKAGTWTLSFEKYGYAIATDSQEVVQRQITVGNGETYTNTTIKMYKTTDSYKGTLKAYPVDSITGRAINNFTITQTSPYNQRKSKTFETAADFRDSGWTNLEGGEHHYTIQAPGYNIYDTSIANEELGISGNPIMIGSGITNLGTIRISPISTISISGSLKLPGYVLDSDNRSIVIWAEASGKQVASFTDGSGEPAYMGSLQYTLTNIPTSAGSVNVYCKVRGYNQVTLKSNLVVNATTPGGTISIGEKDFITDVEPITRDVKVIVQSSKPEEGDHGTFPPGDIAKVIIKQGSYTIQETQVTSVNYFGEAILPNVPTGYQFEILVQNIKQGYFASMTDKMLIEEGNGFFIISVKLDEAS